MDGDEKKKRGFIYWFNAKPDLKGKCLGFAWKKAVIVVIFQEITMIMKIKELIRLKIIILFTSKWCAIYTFHEDGISTEIVKLL